LPQESSGENIGQRLIDLLNAAPYYRFLGMEVVEAGDGRSRLRLPVRDEHKNIYGIVHGGVIAALLDSSCSVAVGSLMGPGEASVTLDLRVNYISNVSDGMLFGTGKALHKGRFTGVGQAEIRDGTGNMVAAGMVTLFFIRREESKAHASGDRPDEGLQEE